MFEHIKLGGRTHFQIKKKKIKIKKKPDKLQHDMMSALMVYLTFEENKESITFRAKEKTNLCKKAGSKIPGKKEFLGAKF